LRDSVQDGRKEKLHECGLCPIARTFAENGLEVRFISWFGRGAVFSHSVPPLRAQNGQVLEIDCAVLM
jgi:hypothetical protein